MRYDANIARIKGGALALPASVDSIGADTLRTTKEQDMTVAANGKIQEKIAKGMTQSMTAGMKGTKEYPNKHCHSTNDKASILIHLQVTQSTAGKTKANVEKTEAACIR